MMSNLLDNKLREDLERLKKIRAHRYVTFQQIYIKISEKILIELTQYCVEF